MKNYLDKTASLTPLAQRVIDLKATEYSNTGRYNFLAGRGSYLCRRCGVALFRADSQFNGGCGWPSFDQSVLDSVAEIPDADGRRTEIICARCSGHLGHVFYGESYTKSNCRHCVNSAAIDWVSNSVVVDSEEAIIAGGCFWGVAHLLQQLAGVLKVEVGYSGGTVEAPTYEQLCRGDSGHYESARVVFDKQTTSYYDILKYFFEIHDPTQVLGQGPDIGPQYKSAIFCYDEHQKNTALQLIRLLESKGFAVATELKEVHVFWPAEEYHQNYYQKQNKQPYCHRRTRRFA